MAPSPTPVRCTCGALRGVLHGLEPAQVNRVACNCKFCVTYLEVLGRSELLDEHGGCEIFQMSPRALEFHEGLEHLACLRLTKTGAMRFYASCCNTPLANTMESASRPFMGLFPTLVPWQELGLDPDAQLGPIRARVNGRFEPEQARELKARRIDLVTMLARFAPKFFGWRLRGDHRHWALFDDAGKPCATPQLVARDARLSPTRAAN